MTKTEVIEKERIVIQPIDAELLVDHYPEATLSQIGSLTVKELSNYLNELSDVIEKYRADKAALRSRGGEE